MFVIPLYYDLTHVKGAFRFTFLMIHIGYIDWKQLLGHVHFFSFGNQKKTTIAIKATAPLTRAQKTAGSNPNGCVVVNV